MEGFKCDTCGEFKSIYTDMITLVIKNPTKYHFCNFLCLWKFVNKAIKKQNKENRFIYGKDNK